MTLFDAAWVDEFGPLIPAGDWNDAEIRQHLHDLNQELATLPVSVDVLMASTKNLPRPDRRYRLHTRNSQLLALVFTRRAAIARQRKRTKQVDAFLWMHNRGWLPADICNRLHLNTFEYDELLREVA